MVAVDVEPGVEGHGPVIIATPGIFCGKAAHVGIEVSGAEMLEAGGIGPFSCEAVVGFFIPLTGEDIAVGVEG